MLVIIRDRVEDLIRSGASAEKVKAARLTADYDERFGALSGQWTTDMFVGHLCESEEMNDIRTINVAVIGTGWCCGIRCSLTWLVGCLIFVFSRSGSQSLTKTRPADSDVSS